MGKDEADTPNTRLGFGRSVVRSFPTSVTIQRGAVITIFAVRQHRLLVESAWQYAREPRIGATLKNRQDGQPDHILQISNRSQQRLHHLYTSMRARGKHHNVTVVAVARELSCFLWAAGTAP